MHMMRSVGVRNLKHHAPDPGVNVSVNPSAPAAQIWANFLVEDGLLGPGLT